MIESVETLAEVETAHTVDATAAPIDNEVTSEQIQENDQSETSEQPEKVYKQSEIDEMIGKRLAREQRKWQRELAQRQSEIEAVRSTQIQGNQEFNSPEEYAEALAYQKAEELIARREAAKREASIYESYQDREEQARERYSDYDQVVYNDKLPITQTMMNIIMESPAGTDVAYYLGLNPKEASRIAGMSDRLQAVEIGQLMATLKTSPIAKKITSAPAPIVPVGARSMGVSKYDTTDPRSTKTMSTSEWIEADRAREIKKMQSKLTR